jgi:hypothetical protein
MRWSCLLRPGFYRPRRGSRLHLLPCHWSSASVEVPEAGATAARPARFRGLLTPLDRLRLLVPEGAAPVARGRNPDDAVWFVALVGRDELAGGRYAYFLREDWTRRLWETMLLGAGSHFAAPGSPYQEIFQLLEESE